MTAAEAKAKSDKVNTIIKKTNKVYSRILTEIDNACAEGECKVVCVTPSEDIAQRIIKKLETKGYRVVLLGIFTLKIHWS